MNPEVINLLANAPETQLDASMRQLVKGWSSPPKAIEILEVLDKSIFSSLASGFVVTLLQLSYDDACKNENITHDELVKLAVWRDNY